MDKEKQTAATMIKLKLKLGRFYNTTWLISVRFVMGLTVTFKNKFFQFIWNELCFLGNAENGKLDVFIQESKVWAIDRRDRRDS